MNRIGARRIKPRMRGFRKVLDAHGIRHKPRAGRLDLTTLPGGWFELGPEVIPVPSRGSTNYDTERAAYARRKAELLRDMPGQFVVFRGEEMIGPFPDFLSAQIAAGRKFGLVPIYIKQVLAVERATT